MRTAFCADGRPTKTSVYVRPPSRRQVMYAEALRMKTGAPMPKVWSMPAFQRYISDQLRRLEGRTLELLRNDDL